MKDVMLGGMMGHCVGDALGVPFESKKREELEKNPVSDMQGHGTHNQPPGTWSDDTSLSVSLAAALTKGLDYNFIMEKFIQWFDEGFYTPHGDVFDYGATTRRALVSYDKSKNPMKCGGSEESDNGSGALMRILPLLFYLQKHYGNHFQSQKEAFDIIHKVSSLTHAHPRSHIACGIYLSVAAELTVHQNLDDAVIEGISKANDFYHSQVDYQEELENFHRLDYKEFSEIPAKEIKSTGYVVDTLEAAIWCLLNSESYESCVLKAVNLGDDTDTIAAIAGGLAGIFYGYEQIPEKWLNQIVKRDYIEKIIIDYCASLQES